MPMRDERAAASAHKASGAADAGAAAKRALVFLFLVVGVNQLASGLMMGVVPVQLSLSGSSATAVGWVATGQSIGFLAGCLCAAPLIGLIGARRALAAFACINAISALTLLTLSEPAAWTAARTISGFSSACIIVVFESWFAAKATPERRGLILGLYMVLTRAAFMIAQIAMAIVEPRLTLLFVVAAACYLAVPGLSLTVQGDPPVIGSKSISGVREMPLRAPAAAAAAFTHALVSTASAGLFPVYAVARGVPVDKIAYILAALQFGGLALQLPLSLLSDRIGRRAVMMLAAATTVAFSAALWFAQAPGVWTLAVLAAFWAGAPAPLYSLAVAHANDIANDAERVAWSGAMLMLWGAGAAVGPVVASMLMDRFGAGALFGYTGVLSALLVLFLGLRKLIRKRPRAPIPASDTLGPAPGVGG
jgi:MFS family permease